MPRPMRRYTVSNEDKVLALTCAGWTCGRDGRWIQPSGEGPACTLDKAYQMWRSGR